MQDRDSLIDKNMDLLWKRIMTYQYRFQQFIEQLHPFGIGFCIKTLREDLLLFLTNEHCFSPAWVASFIPTTNQIEYSIELDDSNQVTTLKKIFNLLWKLEQIATTIDTYEGKPIELPSFMYQMHKFSQQVYILLTLMDSSSNIIQSMMRPYLQSLIYFLDALNDIHQGFSQKINLSESMVVLNTAIHTAIDSIQNVRNKNPFHYCSHLLQAIPDYLEALTETFVLLTETTTLPKLKKKHFFLFIDAKIKAEKIAIDLQKLSVSNTNTPLYVIKNLFPLLHFWQFKKHIMGISAYSAEQFYMSILNIFQVFKHKLFPQWVSELESLGEELSVVPGLLTHKSFIAARACNQALQNYLNIIAQKYAIKNPQTNALMFDTDTEMVLTLYAHQFKRLEMATAMLCELNQQHQAACAFFKKIETSQTLGCLSVDELKILYASFQKYMRPYPKVDEFLVNFLEPPASSIQNNPWPIWQGLQEIISANRNFNFHFKRQSIATTILQTIKHDIASAKQKLAAIEASIEHTKRIFPTIKQKNTHPAIPMVPQAIIPFALKPLTLDQQPLTPMEKFYSLQYSKKAADYLYQKLIPTLKQNLARPLAEKFDKKVTLPFKDLYKDGFQVRLYKQLINGFFNLSILLKNLEDICHNIKHENILSKCKFTYAFFNKVLPQFYNTFLTINECYSNKHIYTMIEDGIEFLYSLKKNEFIQFLFKDSSLKILKPSDALRKIDILHGKILKNFRTQLLDLIYSPTAKKSEQYESIRRNFIEFLKLINQEKNVSFPNELEPSLKKYTCQIKELEKNLIFFISEQEEAELLLQIQPIHTQYPLSNEILNDKVKVATQKLLHEKNINKNRQINPILFAAIRTAENIFDTYLKTGSKPPILENKAHDLDSEFIFVSKLVGYMEILQTFYVKNNDKENNEKLLNIEELKPFLSSFSKFSQIPQFLQYTQQSENLCIDVAKIHLETLKKKLYALKFKWFKAFLFDISELEFRTGLKPGLLLIPCMERFASIYKILVNFLNPTDKVALLRESSLTASILQGETAHRDIVLQEKRTQKKHQFIISKALESLNVLKKMGNKNTFHKNEERNRFIAIYHSLAPFIIAINGGNNHTYFSIKYLESHGSTKEFQKKLNELLNYKNLLEKFIHSYDLSAQMAKSIFKERKVLLEDLQRKQRLQEFLTHELIPDLTKYLPDYLHKYIESDFAVFFLGEAYTDFIKTPLHAIHNKLNHLRMIKNIFLAPRHNNVTTPHFVWMHFLKECKKAEHAIFRLKDCHKDPLLLADTSFYEEHEMALKFYCKEVISHCFMPLTLNPEAPSPLPNFAYEQHILANLAQAYALNEQLIAVLIGQHLPESASLIDKERLKYHLKQAFDNNNKISLLSELHPALYWQLDSAFQLKRILESNALPSENAAERMNHLKWREDQAKCFIKKLSGHAHLGHKIIHWVLSLIEKLKKIFCLPFQISHPPKEKVSFRLSLFAMKDKLSQQFVEHDDSQYSYGHHH